MRSNYTSASEIDVELDGIERDEHHEWTAAQVYGHRECPQRRGELLGAVERVRTRYRATLADGTRVLHDVFDTFRDFDDALDALLEAAYDHDNEIRWSGP